jgi:hypothetical protein
MVPDEEEDLSRRGFKAPALTTIDACHFASGTVRLSANDHIDTHWCSVFFHKKKLMGIRDMVSEIGLTEARDRLRKLVDESSEE